MTEDSTVATTSGSDRRTSADDAMAMLGELFDAQTKLEELEAAKRDKDRSEAEDDGDDCPMCLAPLAPFWDSDRRVRMLCCGQDICKGCQDNMFTHIDKARDKGTYGKAEHQLGSACPLCRAALPTPCCTARMMLDRYEEGKLPLRSYRELGLHYMKGGQQCGFKKDQKKGLGLIVAAAEKGDPDCQCLLGVKYQQGENGLPRSTAHAKQWYRSAAEQGHAPAEFELAEILREEGDIQGYLRHLISSASQGYTAACFDLGRAHYYGEHGLSRSTEKAISTLTPAMEQGHVDSTAFLGFAMVQPVTMVHPKINPKFTKGMHLLRQAATKGSGHAVKILGDVNGKVNVVCFNVNCDEKASLNVEFLRCSRCRAAWYCSKDCQVQHWKASVFGHKKFCLKER